MRLPFSAWKDTLARLGFTRRRSARRTKRPRYVRRQHTWETLEPRQLLTGVPPDLAAVADVSMWSNQTRTLSTDYYNSVSSRLISPSSQSASLSTSGGNPGALTIDPPDNYSGIYRVVASVEDSDGNSDSSTFYARVSLNNAPNLYSYSGSS